MLSAVDDILRSAINARIEQQNPLVDVEKCKDVFLALLRQQGATVLDTNQNIAQFGKIFIDLLVLDNLQVDKQPRWPEIFSDLVGLLSQTEDFET